MLTERRVNRVKQFLVEQGIAENNIETQAVGQKNSNSVKTRSRISFRVILILRTASDRGFCTI